MFSVNKRDRVPRKSVRSAIAHLSENQINPHDHMQIHGIMYDTFSGYVHGAYPHIMEMYGGNPPRYHMTGMQNTPRVHEWQRALIDHTYRGVLGAWFAAKRLGEDDIASGVFFVRTEMEQRYPQLTAEPDVLLKEIKNKSRKQ